MEPIKKMIRSEKRFEFKRGQELSREELIRNPILHSGVGKWFTYEIPEDSDSDDTYIVRVTRGVIIKVTTYLEEDDG